MTAHNFGWRPDTPDQRDYHLPLTPAQLKAAPSRVDLTPLMPAVYDQLALGACVGNTIAGGLQFDRRKQGIADYVPARLMIYYMARALEGSVSSDSGCEIRDAMKQVAKYGACNETLWPYIVSKFRSKPSSKCYTQALENQALVYQRVTQSASSIEACLASGFPISFGLHGLCII